MLGRLHTRPATAGVPDGDGPYALQGAAMAMAVRVSVAYRPTMNSEAEEHVLRAPVGRLRIARGSWNPTGPRFCPRSNPVSVDDRGERHFRIHCSMTTRRRWHRHHFATFGGVE